MAIITDFQTWLRNYGDRIYRYLVYKKTFTPYEQQGAFVDESVYEDNHYQACVIEEALDLGDGEWLLGLKSVDDDGTFYGIIHYYKLSEIRLALFEDDHRIELHEEEYEDADI